MVGYKFTVSLPATEDGKKAADFLRTLGRRKGKFLAGLINSFLNTEEDLDLGLVQVKDKHGSSTIIIKSRKYPEYIPPILDRKNREGKAAEICMFENVPIENGHDPIDQNVKEEEIQVSDVAQFIGGMAQFF